MSDFRKKSKGNVNYENSIARAKMYRKIRESRSNFLQTREACPALKVRREMEIVPIPMAATVETLASRISRKVSRNQQEGTAADIPRNPRAPNLTESKTDESSNPAGKRFGS